MTITPEAKEYLRFMLLVMCYYTLLQAYNTVMIVGVFRAGGDTKIGLYCDVFSMWFVTIPLGAFAAFYLNWGVKAVFAILLADEFIKLPVAAWRYRSRRWLCNITREIPE